jgi:hypothetical protein
VAEEAAVHSPQAITRVGQAIDADREAESREGPEMKASAAIGCSTVGEGRLG